MIDRLISGVAPSLIISLLIFFAASSSARLDDLDNISFEGVIRDSAGAAIASAKVVARHTATGIERATTSDDEGRYRILVSEPGDYLITVTAAGFREEHTTRAAVVTGRSIVLSFALSPAGVAEQVIVEASGSPLIDTSKTVVGDTINQSELEGLPIASRDPLQLVFLLGGAAEAPLTTSELAEEGKDRFFRSTPEEAGVFSLTGAPATSNNITIDGLDNNDDRAARERIALNPEAVAELQIITNQYAAEYGRASGGRVNIRTRGGANSFHGNAYAFFEDESLNANTFFRNARGLGRVAQRKLREGVVFSGPARKQKRFFFGSYERLDVTDFAEINALVPVRTNPLFPLPLPNHAPIAGGAVALLQEEITTPESRDLVSARLDFSFGRSRNTEARFDLLQGANRRGFPGGSRLPQSILIEGRDSASISAIDNSILSNRVVNQGRFQLSRLSPRNESAEDQVSVIIEGPGRVVAGAFTGSAASPAFARKEKRAQIQDHVSIALARHNLKIGGDAQFVRSSFADLFATGGQFTFDSADDFLASRPSRFIRRFNTESRVANNVVGLFIQDEWKAKANLTVSIGARWDSESVISDRDNFSPRVAIAWDPFGGDVSGKSSRFAAPGKTVLRAGFGLFYNRALLRTIDDFSLGKSSILLDSEIAPELLSEARFPQSFISQATVDRLGLKETKFLRRIGAGLEIPYTVQTGFGVERSVGKNIVVTADYIFTRGAHLWRESNINAPRLPEGFASFTEFLLSRDFDNRAGANAARPISGANADVVRFDTGANTSTTPGAIQVVNGLRELTLGLNAPRSSNIKAALSAIRFLRPDPSLTQVELLESTGNSFYHGGIFSIRHLLGRRINFRAAYTLSKMIDEGTTNTASPQNLLDRRAERALSLQDQRHRFSFGGIFRAPFIEIDLAPVIAFGSSRPFNIGAGVDRNLNDIENDRPDFIGSIERPAWRRPGDASNADVKAGLMLAPIGSNGNLPRNYGRGPGTRTINLRASRTIAFGDRLKIRPALDVFNLLNNAVFSFGSEFIDRDDADFLVPRRTQRPRAVQINLKVSF